MINNPQKIEVQLSTGLVAETPLIIGTDFVNIRSLFIAGAISQKTFGLDYQLIPTEVEILSIPKEMYSSELWELHFSNGLTIECAISSLILTVDGYKSVAQVTKDDKVLGARYCQEKGIEGALFDVVESKKVYKALQTPLYYFITTTENVLIPHYNEAEGGFTFVCMRQ